MSEVARSLADLSAAGWDVPTMTLTGFSTEEVTDLLAAVKTSSADDILKEAAGATISGEPDPEPTAPTGVYTLELAFASKAGFTRARTALRRAAGGGKGANLAQGLLSILDEGAA